MGHYAAEMMCDKCGQPRCVCPPKTEKPNCNFIVTRDFKVVTVAEFDADPANAFAPSTYGRVPMNPAYSRIGNREFRKRADAETHAREQCEAAVEKVRAELMKLKNVLKVQRPWEKK